MIGELLYVLQFYIVYFVILLYVTDNDTNIVYLTYEYIVLVMNGGYGLDPIVWRVGNTKYLVFTCQIWWKCIVLLCL